MLGPVPAQQGLGADQTSVIQAELGLVVQFEFAALDRQVQAGAQFQIAQQAGVHARLEEAPGIASGVLGFVQRHVGVLQQ